MITMQEAEDIVLAIMAKGSVITAKILHGNEYMFIVIRPDPLEGRFDPFVKVNAETGEFHDFSPQDYPDPGAILRPLVAQGQATANRL